MSAAFDAMTAVELRGRIARREVSPVEVTRRALEKAEATQTSLNAFFILMPEQALAAAKAAEQAVMRGDPLGLLHGVPFSAKDLIAVGGERFAFGSRCMADNIAAADAPSVERAKKAGGILIGKTTTSEFGCKAVGDSPLTGITRNPAPMAAARSVFPDVSRDLPRSRDSSAASRCGLCRQRRRSPMSGRCRARSRVRRCCSWPAPDMTRAIPIRSRGRRPT
jgi:Asp-tRNA(Asn)/Glu-tRNA(Gln) amidotransferase A subunit family amidase